MSQIRITIGEVRLCYVHLDEPWSPPQSKDKGRYGITALIPKSETTILQNISEAIKAAYQEGVQGPWQGKTPPQGYWHCPLQDGDSAKQDGSKRTPEFAGTWFLSSHTMSKPEVYDSSRTLQDSSIVYPGCYGWISVTLKPYGVGGNLGISAFLNAVMKTRDGDNLATQSPGSSSGKASDFINVPFPSTAPTGEFIDTIENRLKPPFGELKQDPIITPAPAPDLSGLGREELEEMLKKLMSGSK